MWWKLDEGAGTDALDSAGADSNGTGSPSWSASSKFGPAAISFDGTDGKAVLLGAGLPADGQSVSLSFWVYPESSDFHIFSLDGSTPSLSVSLRNQRPLFSLEGLDQQTLPGTPGEEFWAKGFLPLNQWSHLCLVYDLSRRSVRFYLNGSPDSESSFAGGQLFPLAQALRLGPQDGAQAAATIGRIDEFRIYGVALSDSEVSRLHGGGQGDFYQRSIEMTHSDGFELPRKVRVRFRKSDKIIGPPTDHSGFAKRRPPKKP